MGAPPALKAATVVRPGATPKMNRLVGLAGCTSATLGSAANTLAAPAESWITRPVPASSVITFCPGILTIFVVAGGVAVDAGGAPGVSGPEAANADGCVNTRDSAAAARSRFIR